MNKYHYNYHVNLRNVYGKRKHEKHKWQAQRVYGEQARRDFLTQSGFPRTMKVVVYKAKGKTHRIASKMYIYI